MQIHLHKLIKVTKGTIYNARVLSVTFAENPHLYRQLLRAGNLEVRGAVDVLRKFLQMIGGSHPHYFEHVLPFNRYTNITLAYLITL